MKLDVILAAVFVASLITWLAISMAAGGGEAWDKEAYWSVGLPVIYVLGGLAAFVSRASAWKIALWSGLGQLAGLLLTASGLSLWPLGLMVMAVLSLPVLAAATVIRLLQTRLSNG